jgi:predicted TIM-barrel fold metal-dependent hydrolase
LQDLYSEVERVLARHPNLQLTLAHFCFLSDDLQRAARLLAAHPGVRLDLAPHMEMYRHFSRQPDAARDFFLRYQQRILYGTDIDTRAMARGAQDFMRFIPWLIRSMLQQEGAFTTPGGETYHGLGLPGSALEAIYHANFEQLYGAQPARLA